MKRRVPRYFCLFLLVSIVMRPNCASAAENVVYRAVKQGELTLSVARLLFAMRLLRWSDGTRVRVFVLPDSVRGGALIGLIAPASGYIEKPGPIPDTPSSSPWALDETRRRILCFGLSIKHTMGSVAVSVRENSQSSDMRSDWGKFPIRAS